MKMKFEKPGAKAPPYHGIVSQGLKALLPRLKSGAPTTQANGQCDKYSKWLADAPLGEFAQNIEAEVLAQGKEPELLAHAAECDAYNQAREANAFADEIDRGVESLVSGEPSPHFNSRLRARIASEGSAPRFTWRAWAPIAATTAAIALVLAVFVLRTRHAVPPTPATPEVAISSPTPPANTNSPDKTVPVERIAAVAHRPSRVPRAAEPEVLVEPGQLEAAMRFADALRSGRVDGPRLLAAEQQANSPIEITAIEIAPVSPRNPDATKSAPSASSRP